MWVYLEIHRNFLGNYCENFNEKLVDCFALHSYALLDFQLKLPKSPYECDQVVDFCIYTSPINIPPQPHPLFTYRPLLQYHACDVVQYAEFVCTYACVSTFYHIVWY